jgi:Domain of unknown function DUF302
VLNAPPTSRPQSNRAQNSHWPRSLRLDRQLRLVSPSSAKVVLFQSAFNNGQKRKAIQYVVGNPLIALKMAQHDIRASLYAPLRVLIYENENGKTCIEYDKPSSLFGHFGNAEIDVVAAILDRKLEALVARAFE